MGAGRRRARKRTRRIVQLLAGLGLAAVGFVMLIVSTFPDVQELEQGVFVGAVTPGPHVVPVETNETGHAWVEITGEVLPCGLSIHALTPAQLDLFNQTLVLPPGGIDCDNPTALVQAAATHVVFHNQDPIRILNYRVLATYFTFTQPFAPLLFPGLGVAVLGIVLTGAVLVRWT